MAAHVMDEVYSLPTGTKLVQLNEKGSVNEDQPFDNLVELRGNLTRFASRGDPPPRELPRGMREILSLKLPLFNPPQLT